MQEEENDEYIDTKRLGADVAYERFATAERTDVFRTERRRDTMHPRMLENPREKYERLKREVHAFEEEIKTLARNEEEKKRSETSLVKASAEDVAIASKGVHELRQMLEYVETDATVRSFVDPQFHLSSMLKDQAAASSRLLDDVNGFRSAKTEDGGPERATTSLPSEGGQILHTLERRLDRVEKTVRGGCASSGVDAEKVSALEGKSLVRVVNEMEDQMKLLHPDALSSLSTRMKEVLSEYETFSRRMARARAKSGVTNPIRAQKITNAIERIEAYEVQSESVSTLVDRLQTLRVLHEESAAFSQRLSALEKMQSQTVSTLDEGEKTLDRVEKSMKENLKSIAGNLSVLDDRVSKILSSSSSSGSPK